MLLALPGWGLLCHYFPILSCLRHKPDRVIRIHTGNPYERIEVSSLIPLEDGSFAILTRQPVRLCVASATGKVEWEVSATSPVVRMERIDDDHLLLLEQDKDAATSRMRCFGRAGEQRWNVDVPARIRWPGERPHADPLGITFPGPTVLRYDKQGNLVWKREEKSIAFLTSGCSDGGAVYWSGEEVLRIDPQGHELWRWKCPPNFTVDAMQDWMLVTSVTELDALDMDGHLLWRKDGPATRNFAWLSSSPSGNKVMVYVVSVGWVLYDREGTPIFDYQSNSSSVWALEVNDETVVLVDRFREGGTTRYAPFSSLLRQVGIEMKGSIEPPGIMVAMMDLKGNVKRTLEFNGSSTNPCRLNGHEFALAMDDLILVYGVR